MNKFNRLAVITAIAACVSPIVANADIWTLDYTSALLTGTETSLPTGTSNSVAFLPSQSYAGTIYGMIQISDPTDNSGPMTLLSYQFNMVGTDGSTINFSAGPAPILPFGPDFCNATGTCLDVTSLNGQPTGATVNLTNNSYHSSPSQLTIGGAGDNAFFLYGSTNGTCFNQLDQGNPAGSYTGRTISPCSIQASNSIAGSWTITDPPDPTQAPEIDPASVPSALTLLAGLLAIFTTRKRQIRQV